MALCCLPFPFVLFSFFASLETFEIYALVPASKDAPVHPA